MSQDESIRDSLRRYGAREWMFDHSIEPPIKVVTSICSGSENIGGPPMGHTCNLAIVRYRWSGSEIDGFWEGVSNGIGWYEAGKEPSEYEVDGITIAVKQSGSTNFCADCFARSKNAKLDK